MQQKRRGEERREVWKEGGAPQEKAGCTACGGMRWLVMYYYVVVEELEEGKVR